MGSEPEIVDATSVELVPVAPAPPTNLFHTDNPAEVVSKASEYADALKSVIERQRLFTNIQGKAHVNVEGWQLLGSMLGVTAVCTSTEKIDNGWKAHVEARTLDGRVVGAADALCTRDEKRGPWKKAEDYALLSMAQTRATSKALKGPLGFVVNLAGYATTPAEEMTFAQEDPPSEGQGPRAATDAQRKRIKALLTKNKIKTIDDARPLFREVTGRELEGKFAEGVASLTWDEASGMIDRLLQGAVPVPEAEVALDGEFVHVPSEGEPTPFDAVEAVKETFEATDEAA